MDERRFLADVERELRRLEMVYGEVPIVLDVASAVQLIAALQVAYAHPQLPAGTKLFIEQLVDGLQERLAPRGGAVRELIQRGWQGRRR